VNSEKERDKMCDIFLYFSMQIETQFLW